jgi:hypothetical protein
MQSLFHCILVVVTCLAPLSPDVGSGKGAGPRAPERGPSCQAQSVQCEFGQAAGCSVTCPPLQIAHCVYAVCDDWGFPIPAMCHCHRG